MHRRKRNLALSVSATALALAGFTGTAAAVPVTPPGQAFLSSATDATYALTTHRAAWSIAATEGRNGGQSDLDIRIPGGPILVRSAEDFGEVDWVAVNTNAGRLPNGRFDVHITADTDSGRPTTHLVQLVEGGTDLVPGRTSVVGSADRPWLVDVRDLQLQQGDMVSMRVNNQVGAVYILDDDIKPIFWQRTPSTAALRVDASKPQDDSDTYTVDFTAWQDGVYGVVFVALSDFSRATPVETYIVG